jgi:hypothetical protein
MKRKYTHNLFVTIIYLSSFLAVSQSTNSTNGDIIIDAPICNMPPPDYNNKFYIPRSEEVISRMTAGNSQRPTKCANIEVTYIGFGPFPQARDAFQFAVDIWESLLDSPVTIRINARFQEAANANNLGSASPAFYREVPGITNPNASVLFPAALYEKLVGQDSEGPTGESVDINCNFNSGRTDWYFGTDGNPSTDDPNTAADEGQIDFVSVVLHELGHGLGVVGFGAEINDQGFIRRNSTGTGYPLDGSGEHASIWDTFIQGKNIILQDRDILSNSFGADPSFGLLGEFESGELSSKSPIAVAQNGGVAPRTYAPPVFNGGSSYSHWDEGTFNNSPEALMTPFLGNGEAIHDPGNVMLGFMEDMGWSLCRGSLSTQEFDLDAIAVSPNPFIESITLNLPSSLSNQSFNVTLMDINGRVVFNQNPNTVNGKIELSNLSSLEASLYFLKIESTTSNISIIRKVVKGN